MPGYHGNRNRRRRKKYVERHLSCLYAKNGARQVTMAMDAGAANQVTPESLEVAAAVVGAVIK